MGRTPFDDHLARLSRRERTAFVGALLAARGWDVDVDPPVVRATKGADHRVVAVAREGFLPGHGLPSDGVDVVVGVDAARTERLATAHGARSWDAHALYDVARHGLDPAATDRLFTEHFGDAGAAVGRPTPPGDDGATGAGSRARGASGEGRTPAETAQSEPAIGDVLTGHPGRWAVLLLVTVGLVVGGALAAQPLTGGPPAEATSDGATAGDGVGVDGNGGGSASPASVATAATTPTPEQIRPGLTTSGIDDTAVLARGHAAALTNRSFTMYIVYTEQVGGETVGTAREVVRVENGTVYRSTGTRSGTIVSDLVPVIVRDLYADGEGRYLKQGDDVVRVGGADDPGTGQFVERSRALVAWYLSGDDSSMTGTDRRPETVYYQVAVEGTSDRRAENYQATGLVSAEGLVVRVDARYWLPGRDRLATVSLRYVGVGNTTVSRPGWMPSNPTDRRV